ncbi:MAG: [protein-PII] uridylyltransferase [Desulfosalsimonadaceae bacterium]
MNPMQHKDHTSLARELDRQRRELFENPAGIPARELLYQHARLIDEYLRQSFEASWVGPGLPFAANPYAIIALGGYGRAEQCRHSDVDLLFLFQRFVPGESEQLIREIVYPLWDIKMEVGYTVQSINDCIKLAKSDYEVLTALLDARFICGLSPVYAELLEKLRKQLLKRAPRNLMKWLISRNRQRHEDFGDSSYLLEPNLKEGNGGLRDYHTMRWTAAIAYGLKETRDLEYLGCLSHNEYNELKEALSFIWTVRNHLHSAAGRKCDQLYFAYQARVAEELGFEESNSQSPVERFLSELHAHMTFIKQQLLLLLYELGFEQTGKKKPASKKIDRFPGLHLYKGRLSFDSPEMVVREPEMLIAIFEASALLKVPLSREAFRLVREFRYLIDDRFRCSSTARKAFENILLSPAPTFNVLEQMQNTGFLVSLIPEFAAISDRIEYDIYHLYPVDRHTLRTVFVIKTFGDSGDPCLDNLCGRIYRGLKRKKILLWAAFLHDIGKGRGTRDHSATGAAIAGTILSRFAYCKGDIAAVKFLVENHLSLARTATRRDINDEETAINFARKIKTLNMLKMLFLLTIADSVATGPRAWNEWRSALIRDFFLKVYGILEKGELASSSAVKKIEKKREFILSLQHRAFADMDLQAVFNLMSPRYLLSMEKDEIRKHLNLFYRLSDSEFVWDIEQDPDMDTRTVTICAYDRPALFSKIAGAFTLSNINVLNARIHTWRNGIALDIFRVEPPPDRIFEQERWEKAEKTLHRVLTGDMDLGAAMAKKQQSWQKSEPSVFTQPNRVGVDNEASSFFTIIEVFSYDFKGLLYRITDAISRCRLNIRIAKIATKLDQVVDVFYVKDEHDEKVLSPQRVEAVKRAIRDVLPENSHGTVMQTGDLLTDST